ncbi:hypothetical protein DH2020_012791 [Rehmannia glutinosa]|uniref:Uncharacterized protein n=1 Tax=Rehmannia glutinosa TaxID=99300 RepID=A0ABR0X0C1_REHGL
MGSCVSLHKDHESAMELRLSVDSKNEKLLISSLVKQKPDTENGGDRTVADLAPKSRWSLPRLRDEVLFVNLNANFTPSRGSTPVHHNFSSGNPPVNNAPVMEGTPQDKKKRLSELFKESLRHHKDGDEENEASIENVKAEAINQGQPNPKPTNGIVGDNFGASSEKTLNAEDKSVKSAQCCLPSLRSSCSFSERKKKMSPVIMNG